ncbi:MAG: methylthioribulose 1-phosphate dehydratase [Vulcanimicrobiaceae bacterium]
MHVTGVALDPQIVADIAAMGRFAAERGWVPATSGNFSHRIDADRIVITRSGADKGRLSPSDMAALGLDDPLPPPGLSAEAPLHVARYRRDPGVRAIMHVHSVASTVLSRLLAKQGYCELRGYEMQKALSGFTTHESVLKIPVFENSQDTNALAAQIEARIGAATVPGYLLAGHGMYAWGGDAAQARRHAEGLDFLLTCALEERRLSQ